MPAESLAVYRASYVISEGSQWLFTASVAYFQSLNSSGHGSCPQFIRIPRMQGSRSSKQFLNTAVDLGHLSILYSKERTQVHAPGLIEQSIYTPPVAHHLCTLQSAHSEEPRPFLPFSLGEKKDPFAANMPTSMIAFPSLKQSISLCW